MGTTLITGLGLVGTSYAQHALKRGENVVFYDFAPRKDFLAHKLGSANVTVVQRDVRDLPSLIETMQKYKCDTVIHTAGLIGGKVGNPIYAGMQINVMGTINVAEAVRLTGVKRLVQISTFGIYDRRQGEPTPIDESFRRGPGEAYGNSKVAKELMVEAYQRMFGFELIVLRLANVYGVGHFAGGSGGGEMVQNMLQTGIKGGVVQDRPGSRARLRIRLLQRLGPRSRQSGHDAIERTGNAQHRHRRGDQVRRPGRHGRKATAEAPGGNHSRANVRARPNSRW